MMLRVPGPAKACRRWISCCPAIHRSCRAVIPDSKTITQTMNGPNGGQVGTFGPWRTGMRLWRPEDQRPRAARVHPTLHLASE